jgi:hypothetical protein
VKTERGDVDAGLVVLVCSLLNTLILLLALFDKVNL